MLACSFPRLSPLATALLLTAVPAWAVPRATAHPTELDAVQVRGADRDTAAARRALAHVPGGTNLIELDQATTARLAGTQDVLALQPGVYAQSPGNEGVKVSMRGSGINRAPGAHGSGVNVMLDGLPLTEPGGTPYELLEPWWAQRVEILRGANGFERGGISLGGVIDYITRDGRHAPPLELRLEAGSHGYRKYGAALAGANATLDGYLAWTGMHYDGWQRHAAGDGRGVVANLGWQVSDEVETRFFLRWRETFHLTPGRLTRAQIRHDPHAANPSFLALDSRRPQPGSTWLANKTRWQIDADSSLVAGLVYHDYPMDLQESSYRQQIDYTSLNASLEYQRRHRLAGRDGQTRIGLQYLYDLPGNRIREYQRFDRGDFPAGTLSREYVHRGTLAQLRLSHRLALKPGLQLDAGLAIVRSVRQAYVRWPVTAEHVRQAQTGWVPRLGLSGQIGPRLQWFGNLSRSLEPPHPWSMMWGGQRTFGPDYGPAAGRLRTAARLRDQTATTLEFGGRGDTAIGHWQLSVYQSNVHHELLSVQVGQGAEAYVAEANASPTRHRGVEVGLDSTLRQGPAGRLSLRQAYTFSDFRYRHDARFGDNRLPGLPRHHYQGELRFDAASGLYAAVNAEYASRMPVDYANSFFADARWVFGAELGYAPTARRWHGWLQLRNLGNRHYAATVTPGYNDAGEDLARSTPGEGFGVYAGLGWRFN